MDDFQDGQVATNVTIPAIKAVSGFMNCLKSIMPLPMPYAVTIQLPLRMLHVRRKATGPSFENALEYAQQGITSLSEAMRLSGTVE